jgi:hypothetical protein
MDLIAYLIDHAERGVPAEQVPCVQKLSTAFACPYEYITSIGWAVRNDHHIPSDIVLGQYGQSEAEQKFTYFQRKYPTLNWLMTETYELLPNYYGKQTYFIRKALAYRSPVVAGNGWFAVGNTAGFTNPLISPGMNAGIETAFLAATLTGEVLDVPGSQREEVMMLRAAKYQSWTHDYMMSCLQQMNRYWYNMFRDHRLFEALVPCFWATGVGAVEDIQFQRDSEFTSADLGWVVGSGLDRFQEFAKVILNILEPPVEGSTLTDEIIAQIQNLSQECLLERASQFPANKWGSYLRKYDNQLQRVPGKRQRYDGGSWFATHCVECNIWIHDKIIVCPVCGTRQSTGAEEPVQVCGPLRPRRVALPRLSSGVFFIFALSAPAIMVLVSVILERAGLRYKLL